MVRIYLGKIRSIILPFFSDTEVEKTKNDQKRRIGMINSTYYNTSYSTLQTNNSLWNKIAKENEYKSQSTSSEFLVVDTTENSSSETTTESELSMEDYMGMMQHFHRPPMQVNTEEDTTLEMEEQGQSTLSNIDADGDGTISADEYDTLISQLGIKDALSAEEFFAQYDTDEDGEITSTEMDALKPMRMQPVKMEKPEQITLSDIDEDGDGTISADEYDTLVSTLGVEDALSSEEFFSQYDTNSDGELSADEIEAMQDTTTQTLSNEYTRVAANTLNAYETNYQYMFGTGYDNSNSIA
jgi:Ca2+-binding EF-hand superfamily protein